MSALLDVLLENDTSVSLMVQERLLASFYYRYGWTPSPFPEGPAKTTKVPRPLRSSDSEAGHPWPAFVAAPQ